MKKSEKLVMLFDESCHLCTAAAELVGVLDWRHRLHCLPFQAPGVPQAYGLTVAQCERAVWAIVNGSRVFVPLANVLVLLVAGEASGAG